MKKISEKTPLAQTTSINRIDESDDKEETKKASLLSSILNLLNTCIGKNISTKNIFNRRRSFGLPLRLFINRLSNRDYSNHCNY